MDIKEPACDEKRLQLWIKVKRMTFTWRMKWKGDCGLCKNILLFSKIIKNKSFFHFYSMDIWFSFPGIAVWGECSLVSVDSHIHFLFFISHSVCLSLPFLSHSIVMATHTQHTYTHTQCPLAPMPVLYPPLDGSSAVSMKRFGIHSRVGAKQWMRIRYSLKRREKMIYFENL